MTDPTEKKPNGRGTEMACTFYGGTPGAPDSGKFGRMTSTCVDTDVSLTDEDLRNPKGKKTRALKNVGATYVRGYDGYTVTSPIEVKTPVEYKEEREGKTTSTPEEVEETGECGTVFPSCHS